MAIIDRLFYFLYSFSRKHRETTDHIGSNVLVVSILLSLNLVSILSIIDMLSNLILSIPKIMGLIILLLIYGICSIYFYRKKRYIKIIRKYGRRKVSRQANMMLAFYVLISLISIFIVGFIKLSMSNY